VLGLSLEITLELETGLGLDLTG